MNTLENNKLIAEFMGLVKSTVNNKYWSNKSTEGFGIGELIELKYNSDWNELMKVVDKIESIVLEEANDTSFNITIGANIYCVIQYYNGGIIEIEGEGKTKIEAVYTACVEFIKWYNKQKATV